MHESILRFRHARYFWVALTVSLAAIIVYATQNGIQPANGGTWQGYTLGAVGALLILWLTLLGVRKRRYHSTLGSVQGWVSAHVYLGASLLIIATLHCAMQFGWNIHTLAYGLMVAVILSGFWGLYTYLRYPRLMSNATVNTTRKQLFEELNDLNEQSQSISAQCDPEVRNVVDSAIYRTSIGGGFWTQILALDHSKILARTHKGGQSTGSKTISNKHQQRIIELISKRIPRSKKRDEAARLQSLLTALTRRQTVLKRIRKDIQFRGLLQLWLFIHIPMSIALLGALLAHIVSVFFYW